MKITLVTPGFSANETDWCIPALWDFVRRLAATDHVTILTLRYPAPASRYTVHGARVIALGAGQARGLHRVPLLWRAERALNQEIARHGCDVLHALWAHEPGFIAARVAKRHRIPLLVSVLGGELTSLPKIGYGGELSAINRRLISFALSRANLVSVGSMTLDDRVAQKVPPRRRCLLPLGVDTDRFQVQGEKAPLSGNPVILRVGSLTAVKAPLTLLDAFARLAPVHRQAHLHFVGQGDLRPAMAARINAHGLTHRVVLHREVAHDHLPPYYRAADLCVSSSLFESQSLVFLEAAACGTPTAGSAVGVLPELVDPRLLCLPNDPAGLANALQAGLDFAREPGASQRLRERVSEGFGLDRTSADWRNTYRRLVG